MFQIFFEHTLQTLGLYLDRLSKKSRVFLSYLISVFST